MKMGIEKIGGKGLFKSHKISKKLELFPVLDKRIAEIKQKRAVEQQKTVHLKQTLEAMEKAVEAQMFQAAKFVSVDNHNHPEKFRAAEDKKNREEMMENFAKLCEEVSQNLKVRNLGFSNVKDELDKTLEQNAQKSEEMADKFVEMRQEMPWIVEKTNLQKQLEFEEDQLTDVYEQISNVDKKIAKVRNTRDFSLFLLNSRVSSGRP